MLNKKNISLLVLLGSIFINPVFANNINSGGQKGIVRTKTVETNGVGGINIGGSFKYDVDDEYALGPGTSELVLNNRTNLTVPRDYSHLFSGDLFLTYGLANFWDIGLDLPMYHDRTGWGEDHSDIGNLEISNKIRYPFKQEDQFINQAYYLNVILPTGSKGSGFFPRHVYYIKDIEEPSKDRYTSDQFVIIPQMIWSAYFNRLNPNLPLEIHANFGGAIHSTGAIIAGLAINYQPTDMFSLFLEISGESRVLHYTTDFSFESWNDDVFLITPGVKMQFSNGLHTTLAFDLGISDWDARSQWQQRGFEFSTKGNPTFGVQLTVGWSGMAKQLDSDKDGIINKLDKCPQEPEDKDDFEDEDGCPDIDNDKDGVLDSFDECPMQVAKVNGCPAFDADKDGVLDEADKCPKEAEDYDGFEDSDGCPDPDNDQDKIFDTADKCPQQAEDMDGFEDEDGCPELDNDGDGFVDSEDRCPNDKGLAQNEGCPIGEIKGKLILSGVTFQTGSAKLTSNSYTVLDHVIESLKDHEEVKLEIQGHTDNVGSEAVNKKLSQQRAESVKDYIVMRGIAAERLNAVGYGSTDPVAENDSAEGREKNRRVELKLIK